MDMFSTRGNALWRRISDAVTGRGRQETTGNWRDSGSPTTEAISEEADGRDNLRVFLIETDDWTFVTPAQGDAHAFHVEVHCAWYAARTAPGPLSRERTRRDLKEELSRARAGMRRKIESEVRRRAREFPPYRPAEAEQEIGEAVRACLSNGRIQCTTSLRISLSEEVRQKLESVWEHKMISDLKAEQSRELADQMKSLQQSWSSVLSGGLMDLERALQDDRAWMAPWALQLAENPANVADVMRRMLSERQETGRKLLEELSKVTRRHEQLGAYDFVVQSDTALRNIMLALGVKLPELPDQSPLREVS